MTVRTIPLMLLVALAGCGSAPPVDSATAHDPVMNAALLEPLLTDPDLSQVNGRNLAVVPPGPDTRPQPLPSQAAP